MSGKWADHAITQVPKVEPPAESWWATPECRTDRAAFQKRLDDERVRMNQSARFGGAKKIHDDGVK